MYLFGVSDYYCIHTRSGGVTYRLDFYRIPLRHRSRRTTVTDDVIAFPFPSDRRRAPFVFHPIAPPIREISDPIGGGKGSSRRDGFGAAARGTQRRTAGLGSASFDGEDRIGAGGPGSDWSGQLVRNCGRGP